MKHSLITSILCISILLLLFLHPNTCFIGCKNGIILILYTILPALLPFFLVINLIQEFHLLEGICSLLHPILKPLFGISPSGCFPILTGVLSGYPTGAKSCADLVKHGSISLKEGQYLLCFVNNASPMFITSYLSIQCLHCPKLAYRIYSIILLSSFLCSIVYRFFSKTYQFSFPQHPMPQKEPQPPKSCYSRIDDAISHSLLTLSKISGYVIFFSILSAFVLMLPTHFHTHSLTLLSVLEITTATKQLSESTFSLNTKIVLATACTCFGGLSSLLQIQSVIAGSGLSIKPYLYMKLFQTTIVILLLYLLVII